MPSRPHVFRRHCDRQNSDNALGPVFRGPVALYNRGGRSRSRPAFRRSACSSVADRPTSRRTRPGPCSRGRSASGWDSYARAFGVSAGRFRPKAERGVAGAVGHGGAELTPLGRDGEVHPPGSDRSRRSRGWHRGAEAAEPAATAHASELQRVTGRVTLLPGTATASRDSGGRLRKRDRIVAAAATELPPPTLRADHMKLAHPVCRCATDRPSG